MKMSVTESHKRHIFNNFIHYFVATCGIHEQDGCRYSMPDADFMLFNSVLDTNIKNTDPVNLIKHMQHRYQHKKQFCWWLTDFVNPQSITDALLEQGFTKSSSFTGMSIDLNDSMQMPTDINQINVQSLTMAEQLSEWVVPLQVSFGIDDGSTAFLVATLKRLFHDPRFKHFYVEKDNQMVGVGSLFIENGVSGFYNLGVLPEYRNQKIATALKYHRLKFSYLLGAKVAILQSSIMGKDLDQRMGFKPVCDFVPYLSPLQNKSSA